MDLLYSATHFRSWRTADVETAYPNAPLNTVGWGFRCSLTSAQQWRVAWSSNGTYKLHAIAHTRPASTDLGTKLITADNAHATSRSAPSIRLHKAAPASGASFVNFAWALDTESQLHSHGWIYFGLCSRWSDIGTSNLYQYRADIATSSRPV